MRFNTAISAMMEFTNFVAAADAAGISPKKASKNIRDATKIASDAAKITRRDARISGPITATFKAALDDELGPPADYVKRMDPRVVP